jgi:hypothetical protein
MPDDSDQEPVDEPTPAKLKGEKVIPPSFPENSSQETDARLKARILTPVIPRGMESTRTSTGAGAPEGDDRSDEVQPQEEPPDGPSRAGGEKDQLAPCPIQLPPETSQPGGVSNSIRLLEYVRASRDATTGRICSGLHGTARAALCSSGSGGTLSRASPERAADRY